MGLSYWLLVIISTALLCFWPGITHADLYGVPFRTVGELFFPHLVLVLGHVIAGLVLRWVWTSKEKLALSDVLRTVLAIEGLSLLFLMVMRAPYSRTILAGTIVLSLACYLAIYAGVRWRSDAMKKVGVPVLSLVTFAIVFIVIFQPPIITNLVGTTADRGEENKREQNAIESAFYSLNIVEYPDRITATTTRGGGLEIFEDGLLLVKGDGSFHTAIFSGDDSILETETLSLRAPLNAAEFEADAPESIVKENFSVADLLVQRTPVLTRILTSHHYWNRDSQCYVMRVSKTEWPTDETDPLHADREWETLYETNPCIAFTGDSLQVFQLMMSGGRMQLLNEDELLLTVGDHGYDRDVYGAVFAQDPAASYGKTVRIRIDDGTAETFTLGHRNPQGLHVTADGRIWSTEHGPRGGDELNLLEEGRNYGWPYVTYGTDYHKHTWLGNAQSARPEDLESPVYSWVPSIGVSNVIESNSPLFPTWKGDLIVASLRGKSLFRIHVEGERAVVAEPIPIGGRIRDVIEDSAGRLILWTDAGSFLMMEPLQGESRDGSALFAAYCAACHEVDNDGQHALGPDLGGVFGRAIGSAPNYQYSSAFRNLSGDWNEETLGRFLAEPRGFAPGTTMEFAGITDEDELNRVVEYLRSLD